MLIRIPPLKLIVLVAIITSFIILKHNILLNLIWVIFMKNMQFDTNFLNNANCFLNEFLGRRISEPWKRPKLNEVKTEVALIETASHSQPTAHIFLIFPIAWWRRRLSTGFFSLFCAANAAADFHFLTTIKSAHKSKPQQQRRNGATNVNTATTNKLLRTEMGGRKMGKSGGESRGKVQLENTKKSFPVKQLVATTGTPPSRRLLNATLKQ